MNLEKAPEELAGRERVHLPSAEHLQENAATAYHRDRLLAHRLHVLLTDQASDPEDRYTTMPMSTLIGTTDQHEWLLEADWDGARLGDVQIFRNKSVLGNGKLRTDEEGKRAADEWVWWGGVPRGKIRWYRFFDRSDMKPGCLGEDVLELPFNAQREAKARTPRQGETRGGEPAPVTR